ncbi:PH domain-containing protein [Nocardia altamirensis]|uniref:PH domain-containing protein n=1 Tax=Nocardia altamirensis TaxID=472158 RepID=UPI0014355975|nr:PH domain-containing protein [Nocardia altamirensis]
MRYEGSTGQITVENDAIVISRDGFNARVGFGKVAPRRVPLGAVSGVFFQEPSALKAGHLQLGLGGNPAVDHGRDAASDPDAIVFGPKQTAQFRQLYEWLLSVVQQNQAMGIDSSTIDYESGTNRVDRQREREAASKQRAAQTYAGPDARADVIAATVRMGTTWGGTQEIRNLGEHLRAEETVRFIAQGTYEGDEGIVVLTDQRVLFFFHGMIRKRLEDFPLRTISSVQTSSGRRTGELKIFASGNTATISKVKNDDLAPLADAVRQSMAQPTATPAPAPAPAPAPNVADQIRQLADLHASGILTDAEFAAKKHDLLNRM